MYVRKVMRAPQINAVSTLKSNIIPLQIYILIRGGCYIHTERDNNVLDETDPPESGNRVRNRALSSKSVETFLRFQLEKSEEFRFTERRVRETGVGGEV